MLPWNNTVCSIFTKLFVTCLNPWYIVTTWTVWSSKSFASFFDRQYCLFTRRTWIIITWYWVLLRPVDEVVVRRGDKPAGASGPGIAGMHPYGGGDRMVQVSRLYALHRWGHSPLVERSISLCWVIGGLWVEARLWLTSRQKGLRQDDSLGCMWDAIPALRFLIWVALCRDDTEERDAPLRGGWQNGASK